MSDIKMMTVKCAAKINLSLDVVRKRSDGYHDVEMIMHQIPIYDKVTVKTDTTSTENKIHLSCNNSNVPQDSENLAYKAANLFLKHSGISCNIDIHIEKEIPMGAGMAGGSTDAGGVLKALNELLNMPFTLPELMKIGKELGADVPFCIMGGCALSEGIGDILTPLPMLSDVLFLVAKPNLSVSTPWVYKNLDLNSISKHPNTKEVIKAVENNDIEKLAYYSENVLETVTIKEFPIINEYKKQMLKNGALHSLMSGSGSTVFGIFTNRSTADYALKTFEEFINNNNIPLQDKCCMLKLC